MNNIDEIPDACIHGMYPPEKCTICIKRREELNPTPGVIIE